MVDQSQANEMFEAMGEEAVIASMAGSAWGPMRKAWASAWLAKKAHARALIEDAADREAQRNAAASAASQAASAARQAEAADRQAAAAERALELAEEANEAAREANAEARQAKWIAIIAAIAAVISAIAAVVMSINQ
ncbi:MAG: hypothetical protein R3C27_15065 [Hyphomonadaceae bacterium]